MPYRYLIDFWHGISVFASFSYGIAVLGTPPPSPMFPSFIFIRFSKARFLYTN